MADSSKVIVFPFTSTKLRSYLGENGQGKYLIRYLEYLCAKTCVLEEEYIDHDYMIDYQKYYSRSFQAGKYTKRLHFFKRDFSEEKLKESLENNDVEYLQRPESYLGFVVIRPITDRFGRLLIGRTLLKTYPNKVEGDEDTRHFITCKYHISLFGIPLKIDSLPFQEQDKGASACATIALWSALHPLAEMFNVTRYSPAEITEIATATPSLPRRFPSGGLTIEQMVNCIRSMDLEVEIIAATKKNSISQAVKLYIDTGFPLIASLKIKCKKRDTSYHAVAITGYRSDYDGNVKELYVHDDAIGPFSAVKPVSVFGFKRWINEWNEEKCSVHLEKLLVPIYPKIRLTFSEMHTFYQITKNRNRRSGFIVSLSLTSIQNYKNFLLKSTIENKEYLLTRSLPRFMWILTFKYKNQRIYDYIYDATATFAIKHLEIVRFLSV